MTLEVIGLSFGRTATNSMKMALEQLGFVKCHHMYEVFDNLDSQAPLWNAAIDGHADWDAIYDGYRAALDWPTAAFPDELYAYYPDAKYILTTRSADSWYNSISRTILAALSESTADSTVDSKTKGVGWNAVTRSLGVDWSRERMVQVFNDHEERVKALIPHDRLLVYSPLEGWEPLCDFLDVPVPEGAFPRSNDEGEFFDRLDQLRS